MRPRCGSVSVTLLSVASNVAGAKRYFSRQSENSEYRAEYARAKAEIDFIDSVVREIESRRSHLGLSEAELAQRAGVPARSVRGLLVARRSALRLRTVAAVAAALGIAVRVDHETKAHVVAVS